MSLICWLIIRISFLFSTTIITRIALVWDFWKLAEPIIRHNGQYQMSVIMDNPQNVCYNRQYEKMSVMTDILLLKDMGHRAFVFSLLKNHHDGYDRREEDG